MDRIVLFQNHEAILLLQAHVGLDKSWLCEKGSAKATVILKLERSSVPVKLDIGNAHSALIEVLVGRATDPVDNFQVLIPTSSFMSPIEAKTGQNKNQVRFFTTNDFDPNAVGKQWDLLKIVCSQPFDKHVPYGICFVTLHADKPKATFLLKQPEEPNLTAGSFFRKIKQGRGAGEGEGGGDGGREKSPSISERIREAEKPSALATHVPLTTSKISSKLGKLVEKGKTRDSEVGLGEPSPKRKKIYDDTSTTPKTKPKLPRSDEGSSTSRHNSDDVPGRKPREGTKRSPDKEDRRKEKDTSRVRRKRKPFEKLLEDVVFVLSGYQNPERATYRSHALAMGAQYRPDWRDGDCTHLVAAYINTPKCNQVKGKGKIVGKDWVEKCYSDKKRYPWRRFALDPNDKRQPESEEEIDVGAESPSRVQPSTSKQLKAKQSLFQDDDDSGDSDAYDLPTDDEEQESASVPSLPDFFQGLSFYVDDSIADRSVLERYIIAYNGIVQENLDKVDYLVTFQRGSALQNLKGHGNSIKAVSPTWIQSVNCSKKFIPATNFLID